MIFDVISDIFMIHKIYYNYNNIIRYVSARSKFAIRCWNCEFCEIHRYNIHIEFWPSYWNCGITLYFYDFMQSDTRRDSNFNNIHSESFFQIKFGRSAYLLLSRVFI